ncbi:MAG: GNAT family N-acetyltransferase [Armatimonadetes bacterium]|nr:GNAT family N-acetyltransferase [Armatimonadota bacterium]
MTGVEPILAVRDVPATVNYYRDVLDFHDAWTWGDPPTHGGARRDGVHLQFSLNPALAETAEGHQIYIAVRHVRNLYALHRERGAEIVSALDPKPWGVSEYMVRDPNGYRLRFAGHGCARPTPPEQRREIEIVSRLPTGPEREALIHAVGWGEATDLNAVIQGVVAVVEGRVVGCALLTGDNAGYYQVRDVMVHPDWQGRGVGSKLMRAMMDDLKARISGRALVGLYTGANLHDFYARFGFLGPDHGLYGMTQAIEGHGNEAQERE